MATGYGRRIRVDVIQRTIVAQTPVGTPATWWASLHTANPNDDGQTAGEVSTVTSGYGRAQITSWSALTVYTALTVDTASVASNSNTLTFGPSAGAGAAWGVITFVGVWEKQTLTSEAVTGGTTGGYIGRAAVSVSQNVAGAGVTLTIAGGGLTMGVISA